MKLDVSLILKEPGTSLPFDTKGTVDKLDIPGEVLVSGPLTVRGVATSLGDGVYLEANVRGCVRLTCSRCLSQFERGFDLSCEVKFLRGPGTHGREEEDEVEVFPLEGSSCDLDEMIRHEVLLAVPMKPLCKDECRGLCPVCGKNLNEGDCDCPKPQDRPSLFGRELLESMKERGKKDGRP